MTHYRMVTGYNPETGRSTLRITDEVELRQMYYQVQAEYKANTNTNTNTNKGKGKGKEKSKSKQKKGTPAYMPAYVTRTFEEFLEVLTNDGILKGTTMSY